MNLTESFIRNWMKERQQCNTVYFMDGIRKIDAILVFKLDQFGPEIKTFLENMRTMRLQLEFAPATDDENLVYCKVYAPKPLLIKYAKMHNIDLRKDQKYRFAEPTVPCKLLSTILNEPNPDPNHPDSKRAWPTVSKQHPTDLTSCERSVIVFSIMNYIPFGDNIFDVGLHQLLMNDKLKTAFPLHDGAWQWPESDDEPLNDRQLLTKYWANFYTLFKQQPLNIIEKYYGYECATYFAWLGFYNKMLMFAAGMGFISFTLGFYCYKVMDSKYINYSCNTKGLKYCPFDRDEQLFESSCIITHIAYANSNLVTWIYSYLMIIWSVIFKELWKRKFSELNAKWQLTVTEDYLVRPEFIANAKQYRKHKYTGEPELCIGLFEKLGRYIISLIGTFFFISIILISLICIIMIELKLKRLRYSKLVVSLIICVLSIVIMTTLEKVLLVRAAERITKFEMPRTELEYEKSVHLKTLIFTFLNSYGRIFFVAFMKTSCLMPGCFYEATSMMYAIVIAKPFFENFIEVQRPMFFIVMRKLFKRFTIVEPNVPRWEREYFACEISSILGELEEMLRQYGLITSFAACSPLAPIFALFHNLIEVKVDAVKLTKYHRRPIARKQTTCIGDWFEIFEYMTYVIIVVNSFFIAFVAYDAHVSYWLYSILNNKQENITSFFDFKYKEVSGNCYNRRILYDERYSSISYGYKTCAALFLIIVGFIINTFISFLIPDVPKTLAYYLNYLRRKKLIS